MHFKGHAVALLLCLHIPQRYHTTAGQATHVAQGYKRSRQVKTMGNGEEEVGMTVHAAISPGNKQELLVECQEDG